MALILNIKRWLLQARRSIELKIPFGRPELEYIETHLVDQCNMNCCGCSHFSPFADPWFADETTYQRDLETLSRLFRSIRKIRLMGGEPLLHPRVEWFLVCTRNIFRYAQIQLVTNGLLLNRMPLSFWTTCRTQHITIKITAYPPAEQYVSSWKELCKTHRVDYVITHTQHFCAWLNPRGDSPMAESFARCRQSLYCPILKEGSLYACAIGAYINVFNRQFGLSLPCAEGLVLSTPGLTGKTVLNWLNQPLDLCRYCTLEREVVPWKNTRLSEDDWFVGGAKA